MQERDGFNRMRTRNHLHKPSDYTDTATHGYLRYKQICRFFDVVYIVQDTQTRSDKGTVSISQLGPKSIYFFVFEISISLISFLDFGCCWVWIRPKLKRVKSRDKTRVASSARTNQVTDGNECHHQSIAVSNACVEDSQDLGFMVKA